MGGQEKMVRRGENNKKKQCMCVNVTVTSTIRCTDNHYFKHNTTINKHLPYCVWTLDIKHLKLQHH